MPCEPEVAVLNFITPRVSEGCNSFGIVCVCVCLCVRPSVSLSWPNKYVYRPEFWHVTHA